MCCNLIAMSAEPRKVEVTENPDKVTLGALQVQVSKPHPSTVAVLFAADIGLQTYPGLLVLLPMPVARTLNTRLRELQTGEIPQDLRPWGRPGIENLIPPRFAAGVHIAREGSLYQVTFGRLDLLFDEENGRRDILRLPAFATIEMSQETILDLLSHLSRQIK